jgi:hypothetical protein
LLSLRYFAFVSVKNFYPILTFVRMAGAHQSGASCCVAQSFARIYWNRVCGVRVENTLAYCSVTHSDLIKISSWD